jgi:hypothetical protein
MSGFTDPDKLLSQTKLHPNPSAVGFRDLSMFLTGFLGCNTSAEPRDTIGASAPSYSKSVLNSAEQDAVLAQLTRP